MVAAGLDGAGERTARTVSALEARLDAIDRAQDKIERLSGDVLGLQDILSNTQARGAFGEVQLRDIVLGAFPAQAVTFQAPLPNGRRVDCLLGLPHPPGPIAIDAKFPLEGFRALRAAGDEAARTAARRAFRASLRTHIRAIRERYIVPGATAEGALLFLPAEAVYAELHAHHGDVVAEAQAARVWIGSPTTCVATLTTLRAVLRDVALKGDTDGFATDLAALEQTFADLETRVHALERHLDRAASALAGVSASVARAARRTRDLSSTWTPGEPSNPAPEGAATPMGHPQSDAEKGHTAEADSVRDEVVAAGARRG